MYGLHVSYIACTAQCSVVCHESYKLVYCKANIAAVEGFNLIRLCIRGTFTIFFNIYFAIASVLSRPFLCSVGNLFGCQYIKKKFSFLLLLGRLLL